MENLFKVHRNNMNLSDQGIHAFFGTLQQLLHTKGKLRLTEVENTKRRHSVIGIQEGQVKNWLSSQEKRETVTMSMVL